jgi:hypothetical protein
MHRQINSPREVHVVKMFVKESICSYREAKKADKYLVELATRATDPNIQALAVEMLNEHHKEVQAAQDDPKNKKLMNKLREELARLRNVREERKAESAAAAKTVTEKMSSDVLDAANVVTDKRNRKQPERFEDVQWSEGGRKLGVLTQQDRLKREALIDDDFDSSSDETEKAFSDAVSSIVSLGEESDLATGSDFSIESEDSAVSEEVQERTPTEKQRMKLEAEERKRTVPRLNEGMRQLARKLIADYNRVYTRDDLKEHKYLSLALRLIHCKKTGVPLDNVPSVHIKVSLETPF